MWILALVLAMAFVVVAAILLPLLIVLAIGLIDRAIDLIWRGSRRRDKGTGEPDASPPATAQSL